MTGTEESGTGFDLAAYLHRIGFVGAPGADLATLRQLALAQPLSIPFENLDPLLGRAVSLAPGDVTRKLIHAGRGGWCFEQNLLLGLALRQLGFVVTDLAARVVWGRTADAVAARTHRVLRVRLNNRDWLADAGFGGQTLTGILDLASEAEQVTPHGSFRLRASGREQLLESLIAAEWRPLFRFDRVPQEPVDFEAANFHLGHDPASHFVQGLVVSRVTPAGRYGLRGMELAFHGQDGCTERRILRSADEVLSELQTVFGIRIDDLPTLPGRLHELGL
jgi:N-hydroxyarylamine O-acetyltransferase